MCPLDSSLIYWDTNDGHLPMLTRMLSAGAWAKTDVEKQNEASLLHVRIHGYMRHLVD